MYSIQRNPEYTHDNRGAHQTERTVRPDIKGFLIDIVPVETHSPECHSGKNREGFSADSEISEKSYQEDNRIDHHRESGKGKSEKLSSRREKDIGTRERAVQIAESGIHSRGFRHFRLECVCLIRQVHRICKGNGRKNHNGDKEFFHTK